MRDLLCTSYPERDEKGRYIGGHSFTEEMKSKISERVKQHLVEHPEILLKISQAHKGKMVGNNNPSRRPEVRKKISEAKTGRFHSYHLEHLFSRKVPWNKGVPMTTEAKRKLSEASKGQHYSSETEFKRGHANSEETRRKISRSLKGHAAWNKGKHWTEEEKKKQSDRFSGSRNPCYGRHPSEEEKRKISEAKQRYLREHLEFGAKMREINLGVKNPNYGRHRSEETKAKIAKANHVKTKQYLDHHPEAKARIANTVRELWRTKPYRDKMLAVQNSEVTKNRHSEASKRNYLDENYVRALFKGLNIKPNQKEGLLLSLLSRIAPNQFRFVGDGQVTIGGKFPDFMNCNGKKQLIELFGDYWHRDENPQDRINFFKQYGFSTLVVWEHELEDLPTLEHRIIEFVEGRTKV